MSDLESERLALRDKLTSGALSDALDHLGVWAVLHPQIRQQGGAPRRFFGRAYTVAWGPTRKQRDIRAPMPSTWTHVRDFLVPAGRDLAGRVYVAGSQTGLVERYALAGGLSTAHFERIGMEAVVLRAPSATRTSSPGGPSRSGPPGSAPRTPRVTTASWRRARSASSAMSW